jgi:hypothetical protein
VVLVRNPVTRSPSASGDPQLRARVRALLTEDQPGSWRPGGHVDQVGGLGDPGAVAGLDLHALFGGTGFTGLVGRGPRPLREDGERGVDISAVWISKCPNDAPTENSTPCRCRWAAKSLVAPAASVRTSTALRSCSSRARSGADSWASAASNTAM